MNTSKGTQSRKVPVVFLTIVWFFVGLLLLEVVAKIIHFNGKGASDYYSGNWELRKVTEAFHSQLWHEPWVDYRPGAKVVYNDDNQTYSTSINAIGFRGSLFGESGRRIACIGGSTTVNGATDQETYPALLQGFLNQQLGADRVSVLNAGVAGMDSSSYFHTVDRLEKKDSLPDVVLEYNGVNSICWKLMPYWNEHLNGTQRMLLKSYFVKYFFGHLFLPSDAKIREDIRSFCLANLQDLHAMLDERNIELFVASFVCPDPSLASRDELNYYDYNVRYWWKSEYISYGQFFRIVQIYNDELKHAFQGSEVRYLPLAEYGDFGPKEFFDVCHMRPEGIEKKAYILARLMSAQLK